MRLLITAGNTQTPLDQVRCITNIFSGRTGTSIAVTAHQRSHDVTILTSHPELLPNSLRDGTDIRFHVYSYRTFYDLQNLMEAHVTSRSFDAIVHCAAVSDYELAGAFTTAPETSFDTERLHWSTPHGRPLMSDVSAGKVKSQHDELWLRLLPTPKLIDHIRSPWGFTGTLVKFKLEVGVTDDELVRIAESSRHQSSADLIVANTLEEMMEWAIFSQPNQSPAKIRRAELADRLIEFIECNELVARRDSFEGNTLAADMTDWWGSQRRLECAGHVTRIGQNVDH